MQLWHQTHYEFLAGIVLDKNCSIMLLLFIVLFFLGYLDSALENAIVYLCVCV